MTWRFNGARSIDRDERTPITFPSASAPASMGPGRLTGMNAAGASPMLPNSSGFNGARSIDRDERRYWGV